VLGLVDLSKITSRKVRWIAANNPYQRGCDVSMAVELIMIESKLQAEIFYELCHEADYPPTQREFVDAYMRKNRYEIQQKLARELWPQLASRVGRAWATFMADLDLYCQIRDSDLFEELRLDVMRDIKRGIDLTVKYRGEYFILDLRAGTQAADKWWKEKKLRKRLRGIERKLPAVPFVLDFTKADYIGDMHFYPINSAWRLARELDRYFQYKLSGATHENEKV